MLSVRNVGIIVGSVVLVFLIAGINLVDMYGSQYNVFPAPQSLVKAITKLDTERDETVMHMAVVSCGRRAQEAAVMIKSVLMFSRNKLHIHVFADEQSGPIIRSLLAEFPDYIQTKFVYSMHKIQLPREHLPEEWSNSFRPCCTQRIFLPDLLPDVERVLYCDTDLLHLAPIDELWQEFDKFNSIQISGVAWHNEDKRIRTYDESRKFPFYQPFGLNSGVIMMDLSRMRAVNWTRKMTEHFEQYKDVLTFGDQDLFNIFFYYQPELIYKVDCKYNYRVCYCFQKNSLSCHTALREGPSILHGTRSVFRVAEPDNFAGLYAIGKFFSQYKFTEPFDVQLRRTLIKLENITAMDDKCNFVMNIIPKRIIQLHEYSIANNLTGQVTT